MKLRRVISGLLLAALLCVILPMSVLAEDTTTTTTTPAPTTTTTTTTPAPTTTPALTTTPAPPEISLTVKTDYPKIEVTSGSSASFQVKLLYVNTENKSPKEFDLIIALPDGWTGYVNNSSGTRIAAINLDPTNTYGTSVTVFGVPPAYSSPGPGEYKFSLQVRSTDLSQSIDLTATITAQYVLSFYPTGATAVYSTTATAGKEVVYSVTVQNIGSAPVNNIAMSYSAPANWVVTFPTLKIDSLGPNEKQVMDVKIKPADKAIAGDYMISLTANSKQAPSKSFDIRVRVNTPSFLGIVGIIVIVIVIAGLVFVFMRFSRR